MKTVFLFGTLFLLLISKSFGQTINDTIDFNKFDTALFVNYFIQLCNEERADHCLDKVKYSEEGIKAAKHQASYVANTNQLEHSQPDEKTKNAKLRFELFATPNYKFNSEIIYLGKFKTTEKVTYKFLAKRVFRSFIMSTPHNSIIMSDDVKRFISTGVSIKYVGNGALNISTCTVFFKKV
jgi:uncharacterized protein YkwD